MRAYMRKREVLGEVDESVAARVGMTAPELERMYRLLAIANYEDRYVIPQAHAELGERLMQEQGGCGLDFDGGPGNCGAVDPRPDTSSPHVPYDGERFHLIDILQREEHHGP
jgi:nitrate reductase beta subunit